MDFFKLTLLAVGLSMDAFAVAVCKGLAMQKLKWKNAAIVGLWFGGFQGLMPLIGYFLGVQFNKYIVAIDHWIAFVLLGIIGVNMIKEACSKEDECECGCNCEDDALSVKNMFVMAVATSIDALAVGITLAFLQVKIVPAVSYIGIMTFGLSILGVKIGNVFGSKYKSKAEIAGGIILIILGTQILLEHLGILA